MPSRRIALLRRIAHSPLQIAAELRTQNAMRIANSWGLLPPLGSNPLTVGAARYWSQSNEDGILEKILDRTEATSQGRFIEIGVGDGTENNTIALLAKGWEGLWLGSENLAFHPASRGRLQFRQAWITLANLESLIPDSFRNRTDVVSIDVDGNDYHFAQALLQSGWRPRVWIIEYNAKIPVGAEWVMPYDESHHWDGGDFFGASLSSLTALYERYNYRLVACSAQGANAFFVDMTFEEAFGDIPNDPRVLYRPPAYFLSPQWGHPPSKDLLNSLTQMRSE